MPLIRIIKSVVVITLVFTVSVERASAEPIFKKQDHGLWAIDGICVADQSQLLIFESGFRSSDIVCASTDSSVTDYGYYLFLECGTKNGAVTYMGEVVRKSDVSLDIKLIEYRGASGAPDLYFNLEKCESVSPNSASNAGAEAFYALSFNERINIQENLSQFELYMSAIDGIWGINTESAVREFAMICCSKEIDNAEDWHSYLSQILYIELDEPDEDLYESPLSQETDEIIPQSSLAPNWMSAATLSDDATLQDWLSASSATRLSTAALYYASMRSPELIQLQLASGELFIGASEIMDCLNQMIQVGIQTGQLALQQAIQPRLSDSCTVAMAFPG